ncbi:MAG: hypothetical protein SV686_11605 [Thermodesulfobacteriota bacterium]|jgi:hypothetical protein|nr:hypothetical protein [Thermodesulfobacteriota bacterium]
MAGSTIKSDDDLKRLLEQIWISPLGLEASQDLHEGVLLEQHYENMQVAWALKTRDGWEVSAGKAPELPNMRLFYSGDALERLSQSRDLEDFSTKLQDLIGDRDLVFIPLRSPDMLAEVGFGEFAERLGLPGK